MLDEVMKISKTLIDSKVDFRTFELIKRGINKEYDDSTLFITVNAFHKYWKNLIDSEIDHHDPTVEDKVLHFVTTIDGEKVDKMKLFTLIDFYQYFPIYIQKDKNFSKEMYYVLSSNTDGGYNWGGGLKQKDLEKLEQSKEVHYLLEYAHDKIKEKHSTMAQAYRFFDVDHKTAITKDEFSSGLRKLKIVIDDSEIDKVFDFLDKNKDGLLDYNEFWFLLDEKFKNLDPFGEHINTSKKDADFIGAESGKSLKTFTKRESLDDYKHNPSTYYMPLYKTNKKMAFMNVSDKSYHGVNTLPSDNIKSIVNHSFEKDYLLDKTKKEQDLLLKLLLKEENVRGEETKASKLRNQAIKDKIEGQDKQQARFRLKQFDNVKASNYISEITKNMKSTWQESVKKSNIETDSVLKIADLNKSNNFELNDKKDDPKNIYFGDEVQKNWKTMGQKSIRMTSNKIRWIMHHLKVALVQD